MKIKNISSVFCVLIFYNNALIISQTINTAGTSSEKQTNEIKIAPEKKSELYEDLENLFNLRKKKFWTNAAAIASGIGATGSLFTTGYSQKKLNESKTEEESKYKKMQIASGISSLGTILLTLVSSGASIIYYSKLKDAEEVAAHALETFGSDAASKEFAKKYLPDWYEKIVRHELYEKENTK